MEMLRLKEELEQSLSNTGENGEAKKRLEKFLDEINQFHKNEENEISFAQFREELGNKLKCEVLNNTVTFFPSQSFSVKLNTVVFENYTIVKEARFFISFYRKFYTGYITNIICEKQLIKNKPKNVLYPSLIYNSPPDEFNEIFEAIKSEILLNWKGYLFISINDTKPRISDFHLPYVHHEKMRIFDVLFRSFYFDKVKII